MLTNGGLSAEGHINLLAVPRAAGGVDTRVQSTMDENGAGESRESDGIGFRICRLMIRKTRSQKLTFISRNPFPSSIPVSCH